MPVGHGPRRLRWNVGPPSQAESETFEAAAATEHAALACGTFATIATKAAAAPAAAYEPRRGIAPGPRSLAACQLVNVAHSGWQLPPAAGGARPRRPTGSLPAASASAPDSEGP